MKKNENVPMWAKTGHSKPVTRREFMAHGIIPFAAYAIAPNFLGMLMGTNAWAQTAPNCPVEGSGMIPFVTLNLSGGAALAGNWVPMNAAGTPIASYSKMGLGDNQVPIEREFGGATFAGLNGGVMISKMLEGIRARATANTLARTAFIGMPVRSRDDSRENPFDISGMVAKAGVAGTRVNNVGNANTNTGISQSVASVAPPPPLIVRNLTNLTNSLGFTASLGTRLNAAQRGKLAGLVRNLSSTQAAKLMSMNSGAQVKNLVDCAGIKNEGLLAAGAAAVDPAGNAQVAATWGITAGQNTGSEAYVFSAMVYNALLGQAGTAGLDKGGYDYHDNTRTSGDARDRQAGEIIGRTLETAAILNRPLFMYVTSDGSVVSAESTTDRATPWTSDRGSAGAVFMIMFNPAGRPAVSSNQVGQFTDGQAADDRFVTGNNPALAGQAVFANYLQMNRRLNMFNQIVTSNALDAASIARVVKVA